MESSSTGPPLPNGESGDANDIIVKEDIAHEVVNNDEGKGPFKYYVIKRVGGWGRPNDYLIC